MQLARRASEGRGQGGVGNQPERRVESDPRNPEEYGTATGRSRLGRRREDGACLGCQDGHSPDRPRCVACGDGTGRNGPTATGLWSCSGYPSRIGNPLCSHDLRILRGGRIALTRWRGHSYSPAIFPRPDRFRPPETLVHACFFRSTTPPLRPRDLGLSLRRAEGLRARDPMLDGC
jgi:hypothetical protein